MLKRHGQTILTSIVELLVGILLISNPVGFSKMLIRCIGVVILVMGIINLIAYFTGRNSNVVEVEATASPERETRGIIQIVIGILVFLLSGWIVATISVMSVFIGILMLVGGIEKAITAYRLRGLDKNWSLPFINAIVTILVAIIIIVDPFSTIKILWTFVGVMLIVEAVLGLIGVYQAER